MFLTSRAGAISPCCIQERRVVSRPLNLELISSNKSLWWQSQTVFRDYVGHLFLPFDVVYSLRNWTLPFALLKYFLLIDDSLAYGGSRSLRNLNRVEGFSHAVLRIIICINNMHSNPSCRDMFRVSLTRRPPAGVRQRARIGRKGSVRSVTTKFSPILIGLNWSRDAIVFIRGETLFKQ